MSGGHDAPDRHTIILDPSIAECALEPTRRRYRRRSIRCRRELEAGTQLATRAQKSRPILRKLVGAILITGWIAYVGTACYVLWRILAGDPPSFLKEYTPRHERSMRDDRHHALGGYRMVQRIQRSIMTLSGPVAAVVKATGAARTMLLQTAGY